MDNIEPEVGNYLKQVRREISLEDDKLYILLGIKWYGLGMFVREEKYGKEIKATKLYEVRKGDFILIVFLLQRFFCCSRKRTRGLSCLKRISNF